MLHSAKSRRPAVLAGSLGLALTLTACGGGGDGGGADGEEAVAESGVDCATYEAFGDLDGEEITVYATIVDPEDKPFIDSFVPFEECTGAEVTYEGSQELEAQLPVRIESNNAPDIAFLPQPGLLGRLVRDTGAVVPAPEQTVANVDQFWSEDWKGYGTVDGQFYAAPLGANYKSFVWFSPGAFEEAGYEIPATFDDMIALSDQIVADGKKPWCAGIGSGDATGWPATDWLEDVVLHQLGPEVYDQWLNHEIPFNDPQIVQALGTVGSILKNEEYVNGGLGDVQSVAATDFAASGLPILDGNCFMHRQASFYQAQWGDGVEVAEDGDVFAFPFPTMNEAVGEVGLGGGEFVAAFNDRPVTAALQTYLSSAEWANYKAKVSLPGWFSANTELDPANLKSPIDKLAVEQLQNPELTFRFDASDLMPAEVGSGAEWRELTEWIASDKDDKAVLDDIEAAWPS